MPKRDHPEKLSSLAVSRRGFLRGAGAVISSGIAAGAEVLEAAAPQELKCMGQERCRSH